MFLIFLQGQDVFGFTFAAHGSKRTPGVRNAEPDDAINGVPEVIMSCDSEVSRFATSRTGHWRRARTPRGRT